jgi:catalase
LIARAPKSIAGRKIGLLVTDGAEDALLASITERATAEGARVVVVAPKIGGITTRGGKKVVGEQALSGAPSVVFDAVVVAPSTEGAAKLLREAAAVDWIRDAFGHLKVIGLSQAAEPLFAKADVAIDADEGVVRLEGKGVEAFLAAARQHRIWAREAQVRTPG